jgi:MFS transporter, PAT family, beta-lactamase induction signal transducer AmpG
MKLFKVMFQKNMLLALFMGFSSGLPLLLTGRTLQAWMKDEGLDLKVIGLFALVGLPYTLKFLWSPLFDRFTPPFLGRRRGWLLISQLALCGAIAAMALVRPSEGLVLVAGLSLLVSFLSATQDIVVDAFRRESLQDDELGLGSTFYIYGYRIAMWVTGALALILADHLPWKIVYIILAGGMSLGILATLWAEEPKSYGPPPKTLGESVLGPMKEFFARPGCFEILAFILLYKVGDTMAGQMATPLYMDLGFTKTEIGTIAKTFGLFSTLVGGFLGGALILNFGIHRCLIGFGILQALSTAGFAVLTQVGNSQLALSFVIAFEDLSGGMGTAAFVAFMASQTNRRFTATQYALLTSLMGVPRVILASPTGYIVEKVGYAPFFVFCTLIALPGILLLLRLVRADQKSAK